MKTLSESIKEAEANFREGGKIDIRRFVLFNSRNANGNKPANLPVSATLPKAPRFV